MLLIPILIIGIILYIAGQRVAATIILFFFLFEGFQLVSDELVGIKPIDFAIVYVCVLFVWGIIAYDDFIPKNSITLTLLLYIGFILFEALLSRFYYHIEWIEIIRTGRQSLLVLSYFVFRRLNKIEIERILYILFVIVHFQCILFAIQVFTGMGLLTGSEYNFKYGPIYRCYNIPFMLYFFVFYSVFNNPFRGNLKYLSICLLVVSMLLPMHRSLAIELICVLALGVLWKMKVFNSLRNCLIGGSICIMLIAVSSFYISARTVEDLNSVASGDFEELDNIKFSPESTFLYRIGHFYERFLEIEENPISYVFGLGFMTDDSAYTNNRFDLIIGLETPDGGIYQLETPDISWSNFIVRYGIIGTILFLLFYSYIIFLFVKNRKIDLRLPVILYLILLFGNSFTSDLMYKTNMLILPLLCINLYHDSKNNSSYLPI